MPHKLDAWSKEFVESYRREKTEKMRQTETERGQKWLTLCSFSFSFPKGYGEWRLGGFFLILPKSNNCLLSWKTKVVKDLSASWWKWWDAAPIPSGEDCNNHWAAVDLKSLCLRLVSCPAGLTYYCWSIRRYRSQLMGGWGRRIFMSLSPSWYT